MIQIGPRPLAERSGVRNFRCDLGLTSEVAPAILALEHALEAHWPDRAQDATARRDAPARTHAAQQEKRFSSAMAQRDAAALAKPWISWITVILCCINRSALFAPPKTKNT